MATAVALTNFGYVSKPYNTCISHLEIVGTGAPGNPVASMGSGSLYVNNKILVGKGLITGPAIAFLADVTSGLYHHASTAGTWFLTSLGSTVATVSSTGFGYVAPLIAITAASNTLTAAQSGALLAVTSAAADIAISLPAPTAGVHYRLMISSTAGTNKVTITATGALFNGFLIGAATNQTCAAKTNVIMGATAANLKAGDSLNVVSDGTIWSVAGFAQTAACFTVS